MALAVGGVIAGAAITIALLRAVQPPIPAVLRPPPEVLPTEPAPAPAAPSLGAARAASPELRQRVRSLAEVLGSDDARRSLYESTPPLQAEYPSPQAWGEAAATLHDRLTALPEASDGGDLTARSKVTDGGSQDIVTLTTSDGRQTTLFFEDQYLVGFEAR